MLRMTEQTQERVEKLAHALLEFVQQFRAAPIRFGSKGQEKPRYVSRQRFEVGQVAAFAVTARRLAGDATALACLLEATVRDAVKTTAGV